MSTHLWLLSQISSYLSVKDRLLFYNVYIRPHFDYCSVIWGSSTCSNTDKITKLQRRACKLILRNGFFKKIPNSMNKIIYHHFVTSLLHSATTNCNFAFQMLKCAYLKRLSLQLWTFFEFFYFLFRSFVKVELSYVFTINLFTRAENCTEKWIIL